jgi:hypothetical protein
MNTTSTYVPPLCFREKLWKRSLWMEYGQAQFWLIIQDIGFRLIIFTKESDPCTGLLQTQRVQGGWGSQILRQLAPEGGKVVSPTHRLPCPQEIFLVCISLRGQVGPRAIVGLEDRNQWRIPMKSSGIKPANFHNAVPQPVAPLCGSMYSSLSRHSIAVRSPNPVEVYSCICVALPASDWMRLWVAKTFTQTLTVWAIDFHTNMKCKM